MDNLTPPQTAEDYILLVRQLAGITNQAMDYLEQKRPIKASSLDRIAQNVETIASLRGDSGIYETTRPQNLSIYQNEMYAIENKLRDRLISLGYTYPEPKPLSQNARD